MRILTFDSWLNESEGKSQEGITPEQRELLNASCKHYQKNNQIIQPQDAWWVNPETGLVDIGGNFVLDPAKWPNGLLGIRFGKVKGYFNIDGAEISDPADLPREIGGNLNAGRNRFRTLEGIGKVGGRIELDANLLVSLEGLPPEKVDFVIVPRNTVRPGFLRDDAEEVAAGETTWIDIYLNILKGDYGIKQGDAEAKAWILKNKLSPEVLGAKIKADPEQAAIDLAKISGDNKKAIDEIIDQITDLPPGFRDDFDPLADLTSLGF